MNGLHEHVVARIAATPIDPEPFAHCYVRDVFPADVYAEMIARLPPANFYEPYAPPYASRVFANVTESNAAQWDPFWMDFERWINGQDFLDAVAAKFSAVLPTVKDLRAAQVVANLEGGRVRIGCRTLLTRDGGEYSLGPHTDAPGKLLTALFYLPADERFADFATSIYRPKEAGFTSWRSLHYPHDKFEVAKTFRNLPNSVLMFAKTDYSFHGVQPGNYPEGGRNLLMWIPEIGVPRPDWRQLYLPRQAFGV